MLRTGCQWTALPRTFGAPSTVHDRFQLWRGAGVFERMWTEGLMDYDELKGLNWEWQAMNGAKAPLRGMGVLVLTELIEVRRGPSAVC